MPSCGACGQDNPEIARFCLACGAPLGAEDARREERRIVSVVFVDLVGFTSRSEQLDPEDVRAILTPYHGTVRDELESFGGVVEKFVGDAVMAVFGAPTAHGDDPERAVRAALAVRDSVAALNVEQPGLELRIRGAVNTGEAVVTLSARPALGEAMVAGDVVNTASRLQQHAPVGEIVVGEETHRATRSAIEYEPLEAVTAKGKTAPIAAWRAVAPASATGERHLSSTPFIGRDREIGLLDATWERVELERRPHLITVLGPPGVGKSRLMAEFTERISARKGRVVRGRCLPYRERSPYGAFTAQVKELAGIFDSDDVDVATDKLRTLVERLVSKEEAAVVADHLAILLGFETKASAPDRDSLFQSVRVFIEAGARDEPTAFVFEDIHWADSALLDLIELLAARLHDLPVLLLTNARPELLDARPAWGGGLVAYNALPLEPLGGTDAAQLALHLLGADTKASHVAQVAEGNPLFIEQLAAVMSERGGEETGGLPTTIRGLVAARLDALPVDEREVILDASISGRLFWRGALERIARDPACLADALAALERRDLIRRDTVSRIEGDQQWSFKHVLIRDVAYDLQPRGRRRDGHRHVAEFIEASTPEVGEAGAALARHWRAAGELHHAVQHFVAAAEEAERGWAKDYAVTLYKEALDMTPPEEVDRVRFLRKRLAVAQMAMFHLGDVPALGELGSESS
ncbi:MAG TPA: AAA family ATPase [Gaiellaceae bacterium]|jgi:class 3 adenylate cyclase|nr:AAA family ATPase [Gaiellaceae bacterium]